MDFSHVQNIVAKNANVLMIVRKKDNVVLWKRYESNHIIDENRNKIITDSGDNIEYVE